MLIFASAVLVVLLGLIWWWRSPASRYARAGATAFVVVGVAIALLVHPSIEKKRALESDTDQFCKEVGFGFQMLQMHWKNAQLSDEVQGQRWSDHYGFLLDAAHFCLKGKQYKCAERVSLPVSSPASVKEFAEMVAAFHDNKPCTNLDAK